MEGKIPKTLLVPVVRGGVVEEVFPLMGEAKVEVLDLDEGGPDPVGQYALRHDGAVVGHYEYLTKALEEAPRFLAERGDGKLEVFSQEEAWEMPLWRKGQRVPTVLLLVEDGIADPFVIAPPGLAESVQVEILDLDALGLPDHVAIGMDDEAPLGEEELRKLLPGKSFPQGGVFPTVGEALDAARQILAHRPNDLSKLDIEGRSEEGDTLWVYTLWEG